MPNWCNNVVRVGHSDPKMIARMIAAAESGILQEFIPCPQDLRDTVSGFLGDGAEQAELERKSAENREKYGYSNWYDWCVANWGTKWDLCDVEVDSDDALNITLTFDTAWAPPTDAYPKLEDLGFVIEAYYYEPGMQFAGIYADGSDDYYEGWGDSEGAKAELPEELDEMFAISENQAIWEEDEEEAE